MPLALLNFHHGSQGPDGDNAEHPLDDAKKKETGTYGHMVLVVPC